jgi:hypothetical protein
MSRAPGRDAYIASVMTLYRMSTDSVPKRQRDVLRDVGVRNARIDHRSELSLVRRRMHDRRRQCDGLPVHCHSACVEQDLDTLVLRVGVEVWHRHDREMRHSLYGGIPWEILAQRELARVEQCIRNE